MSTETGEKGEKASEKDFIQNNAFTETVKKEIAKLPQSLELHQKLLKKIHLLQEMNKTSGDASNDPPLSADYVKTCMELISDFADLLKARQESPEVMGAHEFATLQDKVTSQMAKLNMIGDYLTDACNSAEANSSSNSNSILDISQESSANSSMTDI